MANHHWMPLYIGDYLADTLQLSAEQHGAYLLMLMHQWHAGSVPDDAVALCQICHVRISRYAASVRPILERYFVLGSSGWQNHRLSVERERATARYAKASAKGKSAAILRWRKPD